jgi:hypothetical protein
VIDATKRKNETELFTFILAHQTTQDTVKGRSAFVRFLERTINITKKNDSMFELTEVYSLSTVLRVGGWGSLWGWYCTVQSQLCTVLYYYYYNESLK